MLKTIFVTLLTISVLAAPFPAAALPSHPIDLTKAFAGCAGRLEALARHASLTPESPGTPDAETARSQAAHFSAMLEAVEPHARDLGLAPGAAVRWTTSARAAQGVLLTMAATANPSASARASRAAQTHMTTCSRLILGG